MTHLNANINSINPVDLDELAARLLLSLPSLDTQEQTISLKLLQLLANGNPVSRQQLAESLSMPADVVNETLDRWWGVYYDEQKRITGYWGLSVKPTKHQVRIHERTLYAWCAWDTLFLPGLLNATVVIESHCAQTNNRIQLTLGPEGPKNVEPVGAVMSFLVPDSYNVKDNIVAHFCHFVYFLESMDAGMAWTTHTPGTFLLSMEDAYALGQKVNAALYPDTLY